KIIKPEPVKAKGLKPEADKSPDKSKKPAGKVEAVKSESKQVPVDPKLAKKPVKGATAAAPDPNAPQKDDPDAPLLDMSDVAVRKMVTKAKQRGYVTYDELNRVLPSDKVSSEQIEDTMAMLNEMGINVIESEEQEEGDGENVPAVA